MSNNLFSDLRKKMTIQYSLVFGIVILAIVYAAYAFTWWSILAIEKQELHDKAIHEGEEWITSKEAPVNDKELYSGEMLAYFVEPDGKTVIINQMGTDEVGETLLKKRKDWPNVNENHTRMLRCHNEGRNKHFRYLATVCEVKDKGKTIGYLYMFENMETYYAAGWHTIKHLGLLFVVLFGLAILGSYWLAGKNIKPISEAYDKQKQFTADASHEMRTPLAVMKLAVQGIEADEESKLSSFSADTVSMLEQEIDHLSRLTENLMDLARGDNHSDANNVSNILLSDMCVHIANQLQLVATEKNITVKHHVEPGISIWGDEHSINRMLIILLDNAIKYSSESTEINISLSSAKDHINIKVADQGIGISKEDKVKIFDRFYRVDKARSRSMGGLGLGLSLAKDIVNRHHGKIWVEDNTPKGSIFNVTLPNK